MQRRGAKSTETKNYKELKILAECQKVTHPKRISHYIMVTVVKKSQEKLKVLTQRTKASFDHAASRVVKKLS